MTSRRRVLAVMTLLALDRATLAQPAVAGYPAHPVKLIVANAPQPPAVLTSSATS